MINRIYNFSAGPCTLPLSILEKAKSEFVDFNGSGMSLIEMSHRGKDYDDVHNAAISNMREVFGVPLTHEILLLQGGATFQFAMIPYNLHKEGKTAEYVNTGTWARKAIADSEKIGSTRVIWSGEDEKYTRMPKMNEIKIGQDVSYLHITSNETIGGIEFNEYPDTGDVPLVADMSSHILSRPIDISKFGIIYAGAQKNLGPAGSTLVILKKDLLKECNDGLPAYLSYNTHATEISMYNTPPVFAIYMMKLNLDWVKEQGGLDAMEKLAIARSGIIYDAIDNSGGWYRCPVERESRSRMNVCFRLPTEDLERKFIAEALEACMSNLKGHSSVGGCRASMYNAMPVEGVQKLAQFMSEFKKANS